MLLMPHSGTLFHAKAIIVYFTPPSEVKHNFHPCPKKIKNPPLNLAEALKNTGAS